MTIPTMFSSQAETKQRPSYDSDSDRDESVLLRPHGIGHNVSQRRRSRRRLLLTNLLTGLSTAILACLFTIFSLGKTSNGECYDKFNAPSPITSALRSVPFKDVQFVYSLWSHSAYKGPPTPAVNRAWHDLLSLGTISTSASSIELTGQHANASSVLFPPSVGALPGGHRYVAVAGGAHHLHCLHYLWQDHYVNADGENYFPEQRATKEAVPDMYERHYEHCVDYLRQGIMCHFDTGIIPYNWVLDNEQPTPNGNTRHKCVNWDRVVETLGDMAVEMPEGFRWSQPEGAVSLEENP